MSMEIRTCIECGEEYFDNATKFCTKKTSLGECRGQVLPPPKEVKSDEK